MYQESIENTEIRELVGLNGPGGWMQASATRAQTPRTHTTKRGIKPNENQFFSRPSIV